MKGVHSERVAIGHRAPVMGVSHHALMQLRDVDMVEVPVGVPVAALKPAEAGVWRCYRNGESLYPVTQRQFARYRSLNRAGREDEARKYLRHAVRRGLNWRNTKTRAGDVITWHGIPQDREDGRTLLSIAAIITAIVPGLQPYSAYFAAASVAFNVFLPPTARRQNQLDAANGVYSTSLSGNQARLDQPIWRNFGVNKITPPFAAQPYYEFIDSGKRDEADRPVDADQYYYAVFAVGTGRHDVIRAFIGKTPVKNYKDVLQATYLPPGVLPSVALCNVFTSTEVGGIPLDDVGAYAGGFTATRPKKKAAAIGIDMVAPQGMGTYQTVDDTPEPVAVTMRWRVEVREVDDYGRVVGTWKPVANEERTANTNTPQRWSNRYELTTPARVEVRVVRLDVKDTNSNARSELQWGSLRAYLDEPAPLNPDTAHYEIVMRASQQLNSQTQTDFSLLLQGYARTWNPDTGWSCELGDYANYTATRNPAWYLADLWADPVWGEGLPDEHIDLQGLYEFSLTCDERQDRFDYCFDKTMNAWDAAQLIAGAGRARCFRRFGINTLARDELAMAPKSAFSPRNTCAGTMRVDESLPGRDVADGIMIEYVNNIIWDIDTIECPCPGFTVTDESDPSYNPALPKMSRPIYQRLEGIQGRTHAEREGLFQAYAMTLRTRTATCETEMAGMVLCVMDPILWQPEIAGFDCSGDVALWDADALVMTLTEPPDFSSGGTTWLTLIGHDGTMTTAVEVTPGPGDHDIRLPAVPSIEIVFDSATAERTKFFAGNLDQLVRITSIKDAGKSEAEEGQDGAQLYEIAGFIDDDRVHQADVHLLPGPGVIQDPVDDGTTVGDIDEGVVEPNLTDRLLTFSTNSYSFLRISYILPSTGLARSEVYGDASLQTTTLLTGEWMLAGEIEPAVAALYEVRATFLSGNLVFGTLDTWLPLSSDQSWSSGDVGPGTYNYQFLVEIRDVATATVQASGHITLDISNNFHD